MNETTTLPKLLARRRLRIRGVWIREAKSRALA